jgi:hypothetical protein
VGSSADPEQLQGNAAVVERLDDASDVLALLVALAEDEDEVAALRIRQGARDRAPALLLHECVGGALDPVRICSAISAFDSERGLSLVT